MYSIIEQYEDNVSTNFRINMEQIRLINYHTVAVHNSKIKRPKQLYKMPWEENETKILSKKEFDDLINYYGIPKNIN
jgi:hypothetical protein